MNDEELRAELMKIRHDIVVSICDDGDNADWSIIISLAEKARNLIEE